MIIYSIRVIRVLLNTKETQSAHEVSQSISFVVPL